MLHFTKQQSSNHNPSSICRTDLATLTLLLFLALAVLLTYSNQSSAFPPGDAPAPEAPMIAEASDEAKNQIQTFKVPDNFTVDVFAAEPLVANPVAFFVDYHVNFYVCESFRQNRGVTDNRQHNRAWVDDDLAAQSVDELRDNPDKFDALRSSIATAFQLATRRHRRITASTPYATR